MKLKFFGTTFMCTVRSKQHSFLNLFICILLVLIKQLLNMQRMSYIYRTTVSVRNLMYAQP